MDNDINSQIVTILESRLDEIMGDAATAEGKPDDLNENNRALAAAISHDLQALQPSPLRGGSAIDVFNTTTIIDLGPHIINPKLRLIVDTNPDLITPHDIAVVTQTALRFGKLNARTTYIHKDTLASACHSCLRAIGNLKDRFDANPSPGLGSEIHILGFSEQSLMHWLKVNTGYRPPRPLDLQDLALRAIDHTTLMSPEIRKAILDAYRNSLEE